MFVCMHCEHWIWDFRGIKDECGAVFRQGMEFSKYFNKNPINWTKFKFVNDKWAF